MISTGILGTCCMDAIEDFVNGNDQSGCNNYMEYAMAYEPDWYGHGVKSKTRTLRLTI